jgi:hypothetical protein
VIIFLFREYQHSITIILGEPMKDARWMAALKLTSRALTFMVGSFASIPEGKLAHPSGDLRCYPFRRANFIHSIFPEYN